MRRRLLSSLMPIALCVAATGCDPGESAGPSARPDASKASADPVVARVGGEPVHASDVDGPLRLRLYDLDRARYEMRRERLVALVGERVGGDDSDAPVEILLAPPRRPRLEIDPRGRPARGPQDAPIVLAVFCDYVSIHCKRLQPTLAAIEAEYGERLRRVHFDAPQRFHRRARPAALAARCADRQDGFWRYHDALYVDPERLDDARLATLARQSGLESEAFEDCRARGLAHDALAADLEQARRIGIQNVPVSFVNGLYLRGPVDGADFRAVIDGELERLGVAGPPSATTGDARGAPALRLIGTVVRTSPTRSMATFEHEGWPQARLFSVGEAVVDGWTLVAVRPQAAEIENERGRRIELLQRAGGRGEAAPPQRFAESREEGGVLYLSRGLVDEGLADREALERRLQPGKLDLEGHRLLKLDRVPPGSLYETLGLVDGDVIMQVDGVFAHDQFNPLWETLRTRPEFTVTIMRRGLPKTFTYRIE